MKILSNHPTEILILDGLIEFSFDMIPKVFVG